MRHRALPLLTCALVISTGAIAAQAASTSASQASGGARRQLNVVTGDTALRETRPARPSAAKSAYLMTYFKDEDHSLHFAISRDGYSFADVNDGEPVLSGRDVADQKGIRDPYIMRGPDGAFYLMMTDLHIFAEREGLRSTPWERSEKDFGWGNNKNMIFMKSFDLLNWTISKVSISSLFPSYMDAGVAWAPEAIFDLKVGKMMVYFTVRHGNKPNYLVYSYANSGFTTLTQEPKVLFTYPKPGISYIDADITKVKDKYHMFYVVHDKPGNIRQAVSNQINAGYRFNPTKVDPETVGTEAPTIWKRYGSNKYVLMYDVFGISPNNMGFSETSDFVHFKNIGRFNEPGSPMKAVNFKQPKHGAVMPITVAEAERLEKFFQK